MSIWTDDRVELLKKLWGDGVISREIAGHLGGEITRKSVIGKARRLGLPAHVVLPGNYNAHIGPSKPRRLKQEKKPDEFLGVSLLDLTWVDGEPAECRYPQGEGPFVFCGQKVQQHSSYCPEHHQLCYARPTPSARTNYVRWGTSK